ncbi:hypothetical protein BGX21_001753 [Mortierella sp. AD011]|nr:hypothetical protein BGX21_001753 [Mortierella sp. AD011]
MQGETEGSDVGDDDGFRDEGPDGVYVDVSDVGAETGEESGKMGRDWRGLFTEETETEVGFRTELCLKNRVVGDDEDGDGDEGKGRHISQATEPRSHFRQRSRTKPRMHPGLPFVLQDFCVGLMVEEKE